MKRKNLLKEAGVLLAVASLLLAATTVAVAYKIDTTPPVTTCTLNGDYTGGIYLSDVTVTLNVSDNESGVNYTMYQVDMGPWKPYTNPILIILKGEHIIAYYSVDNAGNNETTKNTSFIMKESALDITFKTGLNIGLIVTIKNNATEDITDIKWNIKITVSKGLLFFGKSKNGTIASLASGASTTFRALLPIGIGVGNVTMQVFDDNRTFKDGVRDGKAWWGWFIELFKPNPKTFTYSIYDVSNTESMKSPFLFNRG